MTESCRLKALDLYRNLLEEPLLREARLYEHMSKCFIKEVIPQKDMLNPPSEDYPNFEIFTEDINNLGSLVKLHSNQSYLESIISEKLGEKCTLIFGLGD